MKKWANILSGTKKGTSSVVGLSIISTTVRVLYAVLGYHDEHLPPPAGGIKVPTEIPIWTPPIFCKKVEFQRLTQFFAWY